ncbi:MAG: DUF1847 domain-containing protein, partial [Puniceicoccales bacterium]|nr:DUF1847 domain-containing protein [Puniceicoccales bacterium]
MSSKAEKVPLTCSDCGVVNCYRNDGTFPSFCHGENADPALVQGSLDNYREGGEDERVARAAIEVEGTYYGRLTRVEEIIAFANRIGATRIGIATCVGLMAETRLFARILKAHGFESRTAICKVGSVDKTCIGVPENLKVQPGSYEALCNPVLQARLLNNYKTHLNVIVGLCVGHDSLFMKHSEAPVTTLITKDRVLAHNPAAALYTGNFYYKRLF